MSARTAAKATTTAITLYVLFAILVWVGGVTMVAFGAVATAAIGYKMLVVAVAMAVSGYALMASN